MVNAVVRGPKGDLSAHGGWTDDDGAARPRNSLDNILMRRSELVGMR